MFFSAVLSAVLVFSSVSPAIAANSEAAQQFTPEAVELFLDSFFESEEVKNYYVGASVAVVHGENVIAQKGYGYANAADAIEVDPADTMFRIASVSKTFTAVAIMQLAEQGKIDLQADIQTYLEGIEVNNPFDTPVTVEHLLTHQTGFEIRDPQAEDIHHNFELYVSIEDYVNTHMPPVVREPGSSYMYDNFAFLLLGLIVQNVSGEAYEDYMDNHVFAPLQMENSTLVLTDDVLGDLATPYDPVKQPMDQYTFLPTIMPHGGMISTAEDVGKFIVAMLNSGEGASGQLLSAQSIEAMMEYRSSIHPFMPNSTYGFEAAPQMPGAGSNTAIVTKLGDVPGNSSMLFLIPEQDVGVFLTYTQQGPVRDLFYRQFMMTFFPEYATPVEIDQPVQSSVEQLQKLSGLYSDLRLGAIVSSIHVKAEGQLTISDALIGPRSLHQVADNLFVDELSGQFTAFVIDNQNGTVYMKEPYLNPLGYARQGEQPLGYNDIALDHPYSNFIYSLQSLGHYSNEPEQNFEPEIEITRGEIVQQLLEISGLKQGSMTKEYAFADIASHPNAAYIQMAAELGMVHGNGQGSFFPERAVTRQEAAVMIWNLLRLQYPDVLFEQIELVEGTDEWAVPAVKMMAALGYYGPEIELTEDGSINFFPTKTLNRQEAAAILYQLLLQPSDLIVAELNAQLNEVIE